MLHRLLWLILLATSYPFICGSYGRLASEYSRTHASGTHAMLHCSSFYVEVHFVQCTTQRDMVHPWQYRISSLKNQQFKIVTVATVHSFDRIYWKKKKKAELKRCCSLMSVGATVGWGKKTLQCTAPSHLLWQKVLYPHLAAGGVVCLLLFNVPLSHILLLSSFLWPPGLVYRFCLNNWNDRR